MSDPLFHRYNGCTSHYSQLGGYLVELAQVGVPVVLQKTEDPKDNIVAPFVLVIKPAGQMDEVNFQRMRDAMSDQQLVVRRMFEKENESYRMVVHVAARDIERLIQSCIDAGFATDAMRSIQQQYQSFYGPVTVRARPAAEAVTARGARIEPTIPKLVEATPQVQQGEVARSAATLRAMARWGMSTGIVV